MKLPKDIESKVVVLLKLLEDEDLLNLANTISNKQIIAKSTREATAVIVRFSESPEELLKRKKIKKEILLRYLMLEDIKCSFSCEKTILIDQILEIWNRIDESKARTSTQKLTPQRVPSNIPNVLAHPESSPTAVNITINTFAPAGLSTVITPQPDIINTPPQNHFTFTPLGKEFAEWFYKMLNSCSPHVAGDSSFGIVHFFPDCQMKHVIVANNETTNNHYFGAEAVCQKLIDFVTKEGALFNPHLDVGGTASKNNAFGMTVVAVCGTVHRQENVVGTFLQKFGIIKDPTMNYNWRIKFTHLCAQAGFQGQQPSLTGHLAALMPAGEN